VLESWRGNICCKGWCGEGMLEMLVVRLDIGEVGGENGCWRGLW